MIRIIAEEGPIKEVLKQPLQLFLEEPSEVFLVDINNIAGASSQINQAKCPVLFFGHETEAQLYMQGHAAVPYFYEKNTGYFQLSTAPYGIIMLYLKIMRSKKPENVAMKLASQVSVKRSRVGILLHDLEPGKSGYEKVLDIVKDEYNVYGSVEEVRKYLRKIQSGEKKEELAIKKIAPKEIPGVFCDIDGALFIGNFLNECVFERLCKYEEQNFAITLWTGGDVEDAAKKIYKNSKIKWPLTDKYNFEGCKVQIIFDDLEPEVFKKRYGIKFSTYIKIQ